MNSNYTTTSSSHEDTKSSSKSEYDHLKKYEITNRVVSYSSSSEIQSSTSSPSGLKYGPVIRVREDNTKTCEHTELLDDKQCEENP